MGPVCGSAKEVIATIDPTSARNDRPRDTGGWGYTGEPLEDPALVVDEPSGARTWLLWVALLAIAVIVVVALFANPM